MIPGSVGSVLLLLSELYTDPHQKKQGGSVFFCFGIIVFTNSFIVHSSWVNYLPFRGYKSVYVHSETIYSFIQRYPVQHLQIV